MTTGQTLAAKRQSEEAKLQNQQEATTKHIKIQTQINLKTML